MDIRNEYDTAFDKSAMGDASQYMEKAQKSAEGLAAKTADVSALGAARTALQGARSAGLNRGQAALSSGQAGADTYGNVYQQGVGQGMERYMGATSQYLTQGQNIANRGLTQAQMDAQAKAAKDAQMASMFSGLIGTGAGAIGALLASDKDLKKNVQGLSSALAKIGIRKSLAEEVADKVDPVTFDYKGEADGTDRVGIIAQDLEQTPLKAAVVDTPEGKVVDVPQLSGANTAMIIELTRMVLDLRQELNALKGKK